jgi:hypothetical protein
MKLFTSLIATFAGLLTIVPTAVAAPANSLALPYKGVKVLRVPTGNSEKSLADLKALIARLGLTSWTEVPVVNSHIDLEVPKDKLQNFMKDSHNILEKSGARAQGFEIKPMHEDLAEAIHAEIQGMESPVIDAVCKPQHLFSHSWALCLPQPAWQTTRGSILIILMPITSLF